jgi:G3E family GTPase
VSVRHVAVDIVTGFLGSGKTTLLRHVLTHGLQGKPVAVIVNEIGEIGIDGQVVTGLNYVEKMVELSSGCICCSSRNTGSISRSRDHRDLHIIIWSRLAWRIGRAYRVKAPGSTSMPRSRWSTLCVSRFEGDGGCSGTDRRRRLLGRERIDLVGKRGGARGATARASTHGRSGCTVRRRSIRTSVCDRRRRLPLSKHGSRARLDLHQDAFASFLYRSETELDQPAFERMLARLPDDVIRAKGIVLSAGAIHCLST